MYIATYNSYITPTDTYNKRSSTATTKPQSSFKEQLHYKTTDTYNTQKSFPIDYVNKESTFYNKLRMQQDRASNTEIAKSLDESFHVSSFNILKKRANAYTADPKMMITSSLKNSYTLAPKLSGIEFNVQKSNIANIYLQNDAYFYKRAV